MAKKSRFWRLFAPGHGTASLAEALDETDVSAIVFGIMDIDWVREHCLSLPHTTEKVQWEDNLVFKVGDKMYAVVALEPRPHREHWISFKCSAEEFATLTERPGVIPAPYLARAQWVALETSDALSRDELRRLLAEAHSLIFAKLPKSAQLALSSKAGGRSGPKPSGRRLRAIKRPKKRKPTRR